MRGFVNVKIAKSFDEVIKNNMKDFFQIFIVNENGYTPKRRLFNIVSNYWNNTYRLCIYDKYGRLVDVYHIYKGANNNLKTTEINYGGYFFSLSKDGAYAHCMNMLKNKIQELRKKETEIHNIIYSL